MPSKCEEGHVTSNDVALIDVGSSLASATGITDSRPTTTAQDASGKFSDRERRGRVVQVDAGNHAQVKAAHREIAKRYGAKRKLKIPRTALFRIRDLECFFGIRYGTEIPDDDAGTADIELLLHHVARNGDDALGKMRATIKRLMPSIGNDKAERIIAGVLKRPRQFTAKRLGELLGLTAEERAKLPHKTIRAVGQTAASMRKNKRKQDRDSKTAKRRAAGVVPRAEYESSSLSRTKPWEPEGISRSTWERRRRKARANDASLSAPYPSHNGDDTLASRGASDAAGIAPAEHQRAGAGMRCATLRLRAPPSLAGELDRLESQLLSAVAAMASIDRERWQVRG